MPVAAAPTVGEVVGLLFQLVIAIRATPAAAEIVRRVIRGPRARDMTTAGHALDLHRVHELVRDDEKGLLRARFVFFQIDVDVRSWPAGRHRESIRIARAERKSLVERDARKIQFWKEDLAAVHETGGQCNGSRHVTSPVNPLTEQYRRAGYQTTAARRANNLETLLEYGATVQIHR